MSALFVMLAMPFLVIAQQNGRYVYDPYFNNKPNTLTKVDLPETEQKELYRIDFLIPLNMDKLPNKSFSKVPNDCVAGVNFYEGILLALDSLENKGGQYYDFVVHDIAGGKCDSLINSGILNGSDLLIGALQSEDIPVVANFAKKEKINFISALSPSDADVAHNPYFLMVQPSLKRHIQKLINFGNTRFPFTNSVLIYSEKSSDLEAFTSFKEGLKYKYKELRVDDSIDIQKLTSMLDHNMENIIYVPILSPQKARSIISQIESIDSNIRLSIFGMPSWKGMSILTDKNHPNCKIYITSPFRYDEDYEKRMYMRGLYKRFDRQYPTEIVYRAFETTLMAADLLRREGTIFNHHLMNIHAFANLYNFDVVLNADSEPMYYENNNLYIYKFNNGILDVVD